MWWSDRRYHCGFITWLCRFCLSRGSAAVSLCWPRTQYSQVGVAIMPWGRVTGHQHKCSLVWTRDKKSSEWTLNMCFLSFFSPHRWRPCWNKWTEWFVRIIKRTWECGVTLTGSATKMTVKHCLKICCSSWRARKRKHVICISQLNCHGSRGVLAHLIYLRIHGQNKVMSWAAESVCFN